MDKVFIWVASCGYRKFWKINKSLGIIIRRRRDGKCNLLLLFAHLNDSFAQIKKSPAFRVRRIKDEIFLLFQAVCCCCLFGIFVKFLHLPLVCLNWVHFFQDFISIFPLELCWFKCVSLQTLYMKHWWLQWRIRIVGRRKIRSTVFYCFFSSYFPLTSLLKIHNNKKNDIWH